MPEQVDLSLMESMQRAVNALQRHGVRPGEEELIIGQAVFEKLRRHNDVTSGRVSLQALEEENRWLVTIPEIGARYNVFVTRDMSHWCNQEVDGSS